MAKVIAISQENLTLADIAYKSLKRKIFELSYMPGEKLSEAELSETLGLSRTPLRQALQRLQHEGLLEGQPKVGWLIPPLDFNRLDNLYDFRILIECFAVRAYCLSEKPSKQLEELIKIWRVKGSARIQEQEGMCALDESFHTSIVCLASNPEISKTHREITEKIRIIRRLDFTKRNRIATTYQEHDQILKAVYARRSDEAQRLITAHISQSKLEVRKITLEMLYNARQSSKNRVV
jgi:DNA-binding GntR family transcriptional regulator